MGLQLLQNNALVDENTNEFLANAPNVPEGTQVKIPFRFAEVLLRKEIIEILPPKAFKRQTREKIQSGAMAVALPQHQSHFYELAIQLATVTDGEGNPIGLGDGNNVEQKKAVESACLAFQERACSLLDWSVNLLDNLDVLENEVMKSSIASKIRWEDFEKGRCVGNATVLTTTHYGKRKRTISC